MVSSNQEVQNEKALSSAWNTTKGLGIRIEKHSNYTITYRLCGSFLFRLRLYVSGCCMLFKYSPSKINQITFEYLNY